MIQYPRVRQEAEYRTLSDTASEITWIGFLLKELGIPLLSTPELFCDNLSVVFLSANPAFHARTKHFELDHHYVRERVALGTLEVNHIPSQLQVADIFTKSLPTKAFQSLQYKLGVGLPPTPSLRGAIRESQTNIDSASPVKSQDLIQGDKVEQVRPNKTRPSNDKTERRKTESLQPIKQRMQPIQQMKVKEGEEDKRQLISNNAVMKKDSMSCSSTIRTKTSNRFDPLSNALFT
ncbi:Retrovirus-related Pol polyprotein from transposon RE2 [Cardamine amara subsp. amara]|uniref:Retrovirus-related Pol polyprotein from transposon RE2 n=1 Tax=Cardamine amara subsp. amara TaxID=228776 RepID=A0ABD0ZHS2_CARAN